MAPTLTAEPSITLVSEDARGEIYSISLPGDRELMLLHSKKGTLRGGHSHDVDEVVLMLDGRMLYHKLGATPREFKAGDCSFNPAGLVHMGEFLEDTYLIEWKIGTTKTGWKNMEYEPWRQRVRAKVGNAS